jgi:phosphoribosylanthranilate isomerase
MTWIKICGTTNLEDAEAAVEAGANALGFVFYERSARNIKPAVAREIVSHLPKMVERIGVFVDQSIEDMLQIAESVGLTGVQLHSDSARRIDEAVAMKARTSVLKTILVFQAQDLKESILISENARKTVYAVLVDSGSDIQVGGTGKKFDWNKTQRMIQSLSLLIPVIIAGGLNAENVADAMNLFQPFGVDVVSGVEARPGKKDHAKVRTFVQAVRLAEKSI